MDREENRFDRAERSMGPIVPTKKVGYHYCPSVPLSSLETPGDIFFLNLWLFPHLG